MVLLGKFFVLSLLIVYVRTETCEDVVQGCIYIACDTSYLQDYIKQNCRKRCNLCNDVPDALRGTWTGWNYGVCSQSCGGGQQVGYRRCVDGFCSGSLVRKVDCNTQPCNAIQPIWDSWSLGRCSATCGEGQRRDTRFCRQGACVGMTTRWVKCNDRDCPVWSDWGSWASCSATCGGGLRQRTRRCIGGSCRGSGKEAEYCVDQEICAGVWSEWRESGRCSATCGEGTIEMTRSCSTGNCVGLSSKYVKCEITSCQVMTWSAWGTWGSCTVTCGQGSRQRTRTCSSGSGCPGTDSETETCTEACEVITWSPWGTWGSCSVTCGQGSRQRTRTCSSGTGCPGNSRQVESCSERAICGSAPGSAPVWNAWGSWSACSKTCGAGARERVRVCSENGGRCPGNSREKGNCPDNNPCPSTCEDISIFCFHWVSSCHYYPDLMKANCAKTCNLCDEVTCPAPSIQFGVTKTFFAPLKVGDVFYFECQSGYALSGAASTTCGSDGTFARTDTFCAPVVRVRQKYEWGEWINAGCSVTCGTDGTMKQTRTCLLGECPGRDTQIILCSVMPACPVMTWSSWGRWTSCSVTCGQGRTERTRTCSSGTGCPGDSRQVNNCVDNEVCIVMTWSSWGTWGSCSVTCGQGSRQRTRTCSSGTGCPGTDSETETCTETCGAAMGPWTIGSCSVTCGGGKRIDTRVCIQGNCDANSLKRSVDCNQEDCPEAWGEWNKGECSASCGISTREDRRRCTSGSCSGDDTRNVECRKPACPDWSDWGSWTSCSLTCGRGSRQRSRSCPKGADCSHGDNAETEDCLGPVCPCTCNDVTCVDRSYTCVYYEAPCANYQCPRTCGSCCSCGTWSTWSSWTHCSTSCGQGNQRRTRSCPFRKICDGEENEARYCPDRPPCPGGGDGGGSGVLTTQWSSWSKCSRSCGQGTQERRRECPTSKCITATLDRRPCFLFHCDGSDWTQCSKSCGWGTQLFRPCHNCNPTEVDHYRDCKTSNCQEPNCKLPFVARYGDSPSGCCEMRGSSCGVSSGANRIIGGKDAVENQWPWLGYFAAGRTRCGVTLISKNFAITAAHCVKMEISSMRIRFGELSTGFWGGTNAQYTNVKQVHSHPQFDFPQNDIALLELETTMIFNHYVQPVCLPKGETMPVDSPCVVAGWGLLKYGTKDQPEVQQEVGIRILNPSLCDRAYYGNFEANKMICAGHIGGGRDACQGDSGGPLMCQRCAGCEWTIQGIVSFGHKCAIKQHPGVYTKVDHYADWIGRVTNSQVAYRSVKQSEMCTSM